MHIHPVANLMPEMSADEFDALVKDIAAHGVLVPIWTHQGAVIEGRHRWRATQQLGVTCPTQEWDGEGSLVDFVLSLNLHRRHLSSSQRAAIAAEALPFYEQEAAKRQQQHGDTAPGRPNTLGKIAQSVPVRARDQAAAAVGVSGRSVQQAKAVKEASPALHEKVKRGELSVSAAERQAKAPPPPQPEESATDGLDRRVTDPRFVAAVGDAERIEQLRNAANKLKRDILALADTPIGSAIDKQLIEAPFKQVSACLNAAMPFTDCPAGPGCTKQCRRCHGLGWITKRHWEATDEQTKKAHLKP